jgi:hypothetical protein
MVRMQARKVGRATASGNRFLAAYQRTGHPFFLGPAVEASREAVSRTEAGDPDLPYRLSALGLVLHTRWDRTQSAADLEAAIDARRRAVDLTPPGHPELPLYLSNLTVSLHARYERNTRAGGLDHNRDREHGRSENIAMEWRHGLHDSRKVVPHTAPA